MAFAIVLWTEEDLYSVASTSQVHYAGEIFEGLEAMVDWEEGKKGRKTGKKTPYPGKIIKTGDNAEELELLCIELEEKKENTVPKKRQRKKSRLAMESDEMDFIDLTPSNPKKSKLSCDEQQRQEVQQQQNQQQESEMNQQEREQPGQQRKEQQQKQKQPQQQQRKEQQKQQQPHQHGKKGQQQQQQPIQRTKTTARGSKDKSPKISKKADLRQKKNAEIEAGKAQAAAFFKEHLSSTSQSLPLPSQNVPLQSLPLEQSTASQGLLSHDATLQCLPSQDKVHLQNPPCLDSPALLNPSSPCSISRTPSVSAPLPSLSIATLGETGSLIRSSLNDIDGFSDGMDSVQNLTLDESGYFSPDEEEEPEEEIKKPDGEEPERQTVPCDKCCEIVKALKAEIISLRKRQLPALCSIQNISFLEDIVKAYKQSSAGDENQTFHKPAETNSNSVENLPSGNGNQDESKKYYVAGLGKQELVPGSGIYISSAKLHSIHSQCSQDPKKLYLLLIEAFFSEETLATSLAHGSRTQTSKAGVLSKTLNQDVVKTLKAYVGRFATLNEVEFSVSQMNRILTNKVGTAKRKKLRELQISCD